VPKCVPGESLDTKLLCEGLDMLGHEPVHIDRPVPFARKYPVLRIGIGVVVIFLI
jgi:hypothetical protein